MSIRDLIESEDDPDGTPRRHDQLSHSARSNRLRAYKNEEEVPKKEATVS